MELGGGMLWTVLWSLCAVAGDFDEEEAARFGGLLPAPDSEQTDPWQGGMRSELSDVVGVEARLEQLGVAPEDTVLVSARLDWGDVDRRSTDGVRFTGAGVTVRARRLSDGEVLRQGTVVDEHGTYDLSDPEERSRLCTRAASGDLGHLELHAWAGDERSTNDPSFLLVEGEDRTAMIDLEPGESATVVEVVGHGRRSPRVKRALRVKRGDKVLTLTEGDVKQRICLDF